MADQDQSSLIWINSIGTGFSVTIFGVDMVSEYRQKP